MQRHSGNRSVTNKMGDALTKALFLAAYETSDDRYWQRSGLGSAWRSLGGILEYSTEILAIASDDGPPTCLITLRAAPYADVGRIRLKVKAKKSGAIHQQEIRVDKLGRIPVRIALTLAPVQLKAARSVDGQSLGQVYIKVSEALDSAGQSLVNGKKVADLFRPTCAPRPAHQYGCRWGQYWNIEEINLAKQGLRMGLYRDLVQSAGQLWRPLRARRTLFRMLTQPMVLAMMFWSHNLIDAKGLRHPLARPVGTAAEPLGQVLGQSANA